MEKDRKIKQALREFFRPDVFSLRNVVIMGLLIAMSAALAPAQIYITPDFRLLSFTLFPLAAGSALFGPWAALALGFVSDFVNYIVRPTPPYFPGYAISLMLTNLIYAALLYRREVTVRRVVAAHFLHTVLVTLSLNLVWQHMMWGQTAGNFYTMARLINNVVQFPFVAALMYFIIKSARKALEYTQKLR